MISQQIKRGRNAAGVPAGTLGAMVATPSQLQDIEIFRNNARMRIGA